jgi:hypothetical protein
MACVLALAAQAAGCASDWPVPGRGGMAETKWPAAATLIPPPPPGLHQRLTCTLDHFTALRDASTRTGRSTGEVGLLALSASRAQREYAGGLYGDSARTLTMLDKDIDHLRGVLALPRFDVAGCG